MIISTPTGITIVIDTTRRAVVAAINKNGDITLTPATAFAIRPEESSRPDTHASAINLPRPGPRNEGFPPPHSPPSRRAISQNALIGAWALGILAFGWFVLARPGSPPVAPLPGPAMNAPVRTPSSTPPMPTHPIQVQTAPDPNAAFGLE